RRAAATGFDWDDAARARAKVIEELAEVDAAATPAERIDEVGDMLFALVNWARWLGVDPEAALHQATDKFSRRFNAMEEIAGTGFELLPLADKEALWQSVKQRLSAPDQPHRPQQQPTRDRA
ncbi:MAG TPA: nucleoside triphosphate pyrophosphohydrolase, partial [Sphingomonas sp.]